MDDLAGLLAEFPTLAASVFGPNYLSRFEPDSREYRYYYSFYLLSLRNTPAWLTHCHICVAAYRWPKPSKYPTIERIDYYKTKLDEIFIELDV